MAAREEQPSNLDPVVFYKISSAGYLNNVYSDRALMRYWPDIRFRAMDLKEELPRHSTYDLKKYLKFMAKSVRYQAGATEKSAERLKRVKDRFFTGLF